MIKILLIVVLFVTGLQCRVPPDEGSKVAGQNKPEDRSVERPSNATTKAADSQNGQEFSKEASTYEKGKAATSERSAETEEPKTADSETSTKRLVRSTVALRGGRSEDSEGTTKTATNVKSTRSVRNLENYNNEPTHERLERHDNESQESKSGSIETQTAEREELSHINNKEQSARLSTEEENTEAVSKESESKEKYKSASSENESKIGSAELKKSSEESQQKSANQKENSRSTKETSQVSDKSGSEPDEGVESLVKSDIAALEESSPLTRRMLDDDSNKRDEIEESPETADTRMAPREGSPEFRDYYFGSRSTQSQYPYSSIERPSPPSFLPFSFSKESLPSSDILPSISNILPAISRSGENYFAALPNSFRNGQSFKPLEPLPPLPPLGHMKPFKPFPPLQPLNENEPFRPLPPLPPLDRVGLFKPLPPLRPLDYNELLRPLPPLPFKPLPPLRSLERNEPFRPLPPLLPLDPIAPFKRLPPLPPLEPFSSFKPRQQQPFPDQQALQEQFQNWNPQQTFQNLFPTVPHSLNSMPKFSPPELPNIFSMLRQAEPDASSVSSYSRSESYSSN